MTDNREINELAGAIGALETQRGLMGDRVVDISIKALKYKVSERQKILAQSDQLSRCVSVLFAEVSGFTAICRQNDAENVTEAVNTLWRSLESMIIAFGGSVDKHIDHREGEAICNLNLGDTALAFKELARAELYFTIFIRISSVTGIRPIMFASLRGFAKVCGILGRVQMGIFFLLIASGDDTMDPGEKRKTQSILADLRSGMSDEDYSLIESRARSSSVENLLQDVVSP